MAQAPRTVALDGLRALAALVVIFTHATGAIAKTKWQALALYQSPLVVLLNATGAVHVFFVISGYCLTASALRAAAPRGLAQFYLRRVARIHGPYVAVALLAWQASTWLYPDPVPGVSIWLRDLLRVRGSFAEFLPFLAFPGAVGGLLPQGWTLEVEMIFSLLLPFMVLAATRLHWGALVIASLISLAVSEQPFGAPRYALDFATGIVLFLERERLTALFARLPALAAPALGLVGLVLLNVPPYTLLGARNLRLAALFFAAGATLIVLGAVHAAPLARFLEWRPIAYLGRVSYSIYLLHFTVLALCSPLLGDGVGAAGGVAFVALITLLTCALAPLSYRFVELPCIAAGQAANRWLSRRMGAAPRPAEPG